MTRWLPVIVFSLVVAVTACAPTPGLFNSDQLNGGRPPLGKPAMRSSITVLHVDSVFKKWKARGDHQAFREGLVNSLDTARLYTRFSYNVRYHLSADLKRLDDRTPAGGPGMTAEIAYRVTGPGGKEVFQEIIISHADANVGKARGGRPGAMNVDVAAKAIRRNFRTLTDTLAALRP